MLDKFETDSKLRRLKMYSWLHFIRYHDLVSPRNWLMKYVYMRSLEKKRKDKLLDLLLIRFTIEGDRRNTRGNKMVVRWLLNNRMSENE